MTPTSPLVIDPIARPRQRRWTKRTRRNTITGLLFISPWLIGFLGFYLYPALASLYYSFTDFRILSTPEWIGLQNYQRMVNDPLFWKALGNTIWLVLVMVPISVGVALAVSLLLNVRGIFGMSIFRTIFYLPVVVPAVASAVLWIWLLNPKYGLVNAALGVVGIDGPQWFYDAAWAKPGLVLMAVWAVGDVIIIYLGALQGVPRDLYDAAEVDGAGIRGKLRHVTIPMISPAILFNLVTGAIGAFQYFTQAYVVSEGTVGRGSGAVGGTQNSLLFYGLSIYNQAFRYFQLGYASAMAWVLMLIILATTGLLLWLSRRRVYYAGEH